MTTTYFSGTATGEPTKATNHLGWEVQELVADSTQGWNNPFKDAKGEPLTFAEVVDACAFRDTLLPSATEYRVYEALGGAVACCGRCATSLARGSIPSPHANSDLTNNDNNA